MKTNFCLREKSQPRMGKGERVFCSVIESISGMEDIAIQAKFQRVHNRLLAKFRKTGFVSLRERMGTAEYTALTAGRSARMSRRFREKARFVTVTEQIGEEEYSRLTRGRTARLSARIREKKGLTGETVQKETVVSPYVCRESMSIVRKIDAIIKKVDSGRTSRKRSQAEIDRDIVRKFYSDPNPDAFSALWERFKYGIQSYISGIVGDWDNADDLVQDTFQRAWEKKFMYDPNKSNFSTWLYTVARNITFSQIKKNAQDRTIDVDVNDVFASSLHPNGENAAHNDDAYCILNDNNEIETGTFEGVTKKMYDASVNEIRNMDPLFQQIIEMKNMQNMTLREIAGCMNMTESKVKNCYYKNKEILAETIKTKYNDLYVIYREANHDHDEEDSMFY